MISNSIAVTLQNDTLSLRKDESNVFHGFGLKLIKTFSWFSNFFARKFLLPKLNRVISMQAKLTLMCNSLAQDIERGQEGKPLDQNFTMRDALDKLKAVSIDVRDACIKFECEFNPSKEVAQSFTTAQNVCQELYASATALQWAIAEHDADLSGRLEGFTASSAKEAEDLLNKILAAA